MSQSLLQSQINNESSLENSLFSEINELSESSISTSSYVPIDSSDYSVMNSFFKEDCGLKNELHIPSDLDASEDATYARHDDVGEGLDSYGFFDNSMIHEGSTPAQSKIAPRNLTEILETIPDMPPQSLTDSQIRQKDKLTERIINMATGAIIGIAATALLLFATSRKANSE